MNDPAPITTWLTDMDGVLVHEEVAIPGAADFIEALKSSDLRFMVLTNNSIFTPRDLRARFIAHNPNPSGPSAHGKLPATGSTRPDQIERFPYRPTRVADSVADLVELVSQRAPRR